MNKQMVTVALSPETSHPVEASELLHMDWRKRNTEARADYYVALRASIGH